MNCFNLCFALVFVFGFSVWSCNAIQCFVCAGTDTCNDPFDESQTTLVVDSCEACVKAKAGDVVTRTCSPAAGTDGCIEVSEAHTCTCSSDKCNSAGDLKPSMKMLTLFCMMIWLFRKMW